MQYNAHGRSLKLQSLQVPALVHLTVRSFLRLANINKNFPVGHSSGGSSRLDVIKSQKNLSSHWAWLVAVGGAWWLYCSFLMFSSHSLYILEAFIHESDNM